MSPRFAPSKFDAPRLVSRLVPRPRLFGELDRGAGLQLTLVGGAAGAGKTTLLASWLASRPSVPAAWIGCDAGDGDPNRFLTALVQGLRQGLAEPGIGADALELIGEGEASVDAVGALVDDLQELAGRQVVVVDDFQVVSAAGAKVFSQFLESRPLSLQVVVAARTDPPLRLNRMRAREELVELRDDALAFSPEEARGLFAGFGLSLTDSEIEDVRRRTEGWSVGLQLAALSIQTSADRASSVGRAEVHSSTVAGYFVEEVLSQQQQDVIDFMLDSSVLDDLSVETCTAVLGEGSALLLERLASAHMFLTVVDERAGTYRYNQLIKEVLRAELRRRDPGREAELHEAAARTLLDAGHAAAAARHLVAAGDSTAAFRSLSQRLVADVLTHPTIGSALDLDEVRPELFARVPEVLIPLAAELLWRGAFDRGARAVALARQVPVEPDQDAALAVQYGLVNTLYCTFVGEFDEALRHRARVRSFEQSVTGVEDWVVTLDALAMYCHTYTGDSQAAQRLADLLVDRATSEPMTELLCPGVMSQAAVLTGRLGDAAALADRTLRSAQRLGFERHFFVFHALRTTSQLALERRDLQAAIEPVEIALSFVRGARPAFSFLAQVDRARIWSAGGQHQEALSSLAAARAALKSQRSHFQADADELEARLRLTLGDHGGARRFAERLPATRRAVMQAIIALATGDGGAAARALDSSNGAAPTPRSDVELQLLRANLTLVDRPRDAPPVVRRALTAAQHSGFLQTVLDTAPQLVDDVVARADLYPAAGNLRPLIAAHLDARATAGANPRRQSVVPLTEAEMRVLATLAEHYTLSETAKELSVSINTVRTHTRHAYMKLGVNSRSEAISRATVLGLIR